MRWDPVLLVYEVQESSDFTYRVFDWNRPQTGRRVLHIDKSLAVANPAASSQPVPTPEMKDGESQIMQSEYFTLELLNSQKQALWSQILLSGRSMQSPSSKE